MSNNINALYIGNAVEVNMSRVLCEALCRKIKSMNQ